MVVGAGSFLGIWAILHSFASNNICYVLLLFLSYCFHLLQIQCIKLKLAPDSRPSFPDIQIKVSTLTGYVVLEEYEEVGEYEVFVEFVEISEISEISEFVILVAHL